MDLEGKVVDGERKPSSEHALHRIFYTGRKDIGAVVHTHSTYATVLGTLGEGPLRFQLPGGLRRTRRALRRLRLLRHPGAGLGHLRRHGGPQGRHHGQSRPGRRDRDIASAFTVAEQIEQCCRVYVLARAIGTPVILPPEEMERMAGRFQTYGQLRK